MGFHATLPTSYLTRFGGQLRVHWLGLLLDETRDQVVLCCDHCLALNIPVDVIASEALRVKNALE